MTEQQRPDEDVEGHSKRFYQDPDAPEGSEEDSADDVAGHGRRGVADDDVEGHHVMWKQDPEASEDDVEGHGGKRTL
jgi:hypothetical protein